MNAKLSKGKIYCIISAVFIFGFYILERVIDICFGVTKNIAVTQAIVYTLATVIIYFLVSKSEETFYGLLTAIFGFRMMPTKINGLSQVSEEAGLVYFIVQKFSLIIFAILIIKLYRLQKAPREIKPIPILVTIVAVPFSIEVYTYVSEALLNITGNMLYSYFACFAIYSLTLIVLLCMAVMTDYHSSRLVADYEIVALSLNLGRRICTVIILASKGVHISKSYYCWIAIYAFFMAAFLFVRFVRRKQYKALTS